MSQPAFLHELQHATNTCPYVFIDSSSSTANLMETGKSVFATECEKIKEYLLQLNFKETDHCELYLWTTYCRHYGNIAISELDTIKNTDLYGSSSHMQSVLRYICDDINDPTTQSQSKKTEYADVYIVTDGTINDLHKDLQKELLNVCKTAPNINFTIMSVEPSSTNYEKDLLAMTELPIYERMLKSNAVSHIRKFIYYNNFHTDTPFIETISCNMQPNQISYKNMYFDIADIHKFMQYITNEKITNETNIDYNRANINCRLVYDLIHTIKQIVDGKTKAFTTYIATMFAEIFKYTDNYNVILNALSQNNFELYNDYISNRCTLFERIDNKDMYDNFKNVFNTKQYVTFPYATQNEMAIMVANYGDVTQTVYSGKLKYINAGICIGDYNIPVLPYITTSSSAYHHISNDATNRVLRRYIRSIYANIHDLHPTSDDILYLFLTDVMRIVYNKNISDNIKDLYRLYGLIMLDRKRAGPCDTQIRESEYLLSNGPIRVSNNKRNVDVTINTDTDTDYNISDILAYSMQKYGYTCQPATLWFAIVCALDSHDIIASQYKCCKDAIASDTNIPLSDINIQNATASISTMFANTTINQHTYDNIIQDINNPQHKYCFVTLKVINFDKYAVPVHNTSHHTPCTFDGVLSNKGIDILKKQNAHTFECPYCNTVISFDKLIVLPQRIASQQFMPSESAFHHKITTIDDAYVHHQRFLTKNPVNTLDMYHENDTLPPQINKNKGYADPVYSVPLNNISCDIFTTKQFIDNIPEQYKFVQTLSRIPNVCIAGGFCRSIMTHQPVKDIDIFMYGPSKNYHCTVYDIHDTIKSCIEKINDNYDTILFMKPDNNVLEIIVIDNKHNIPPMDIVDWIDRANINTDIDVDKDEDVPIDTNYDHVDDCYATLVNDNNDDNVMPCDIVLPAQTSQYPPQPTPTRQDDATRHANSILGEKINDTAIVYKLQIILRKHDSIDTLLQDFDFSASQVCLANDQIYMTESAYMSYKYMINFCLFYPTTFIYRIIKYMSYGFDMINPDCYVEKTTNTLVYKDKDGKFVTLCKIKYENNNVYYCDTTTVNYRPDDDDVDRYYRESIKFWNCGSFYRLIVKYIIDNRRKQEICYDYYNHVSYRTKGNVDIIECYPDMYNIDFKVKK